MGRGHGGTGGSRPGGGGSVSGVNRYGERVSYSLKQEISDYRQVYSQLESEIGDAMKSQAKGMSTSDLQRYLGSRKETGETQIKNAWKENVAKFKSGEYDIGIVSYGSSDWGKSARKSIARMELQKNVIQSELKSRGVQ